MIDEEGLIRRLIRLGEKALKYINDADRPVKVIAIFALFMAVALTATLVLDRTINYLIRIIVVKYFGIPPPPSLDPVCIVATYIFLIILLIIAVLCDRQRK